MLHWLSDLGNVNYNPNGAIFFNTGCILTSLVLIIFFAGYSHWNFASRNKNSLLITSKLAGFFDAFTLAMLGIYPETTIYVHNIFAFMFFYTNMAFMILASITFFLHARSFKGVSIYGLLVAAISLAFLVLPVVPQILEWIVVVSSLGFVGMMVANAVFSVYKIK